VLLHTERESDTEKTKLCGWSHRSKQLKIYKEEAQGIVATLPHAISQYYWSRILLSFNSDGSRLALSEAEVDPGTVIVWDTSILPQVIQIASFPVRGRQISIKFNSSSDLLLVRTLNKIYLFGVTDQSTKFEVDTFNVGIRNYSEALFSCDERTVVCPVSTNPRYLCSNVLKTWSTSLMGSSHIEDIENTEGSHALSISYRFCEICCMAASPTENHAAVGYSKNAVIIWNIYTCVQVRILEHTRAMSRICYTADGTQLVVDDTWELNIWDLASDAVVHTFSQGISRSGWCSSLFASHSSVTGRPLVFRTNGNGRVMVYDGESGEVLHTLEDFSFPCYCSQSGSMVLM
jgi:WD40 repeat protein